MDPYTRRLIVAVSVVIGYLSFGTVAFHQLEGWRYFDAFYFSSITLTTVGYGDLLPTTDASKLLAVIYAFSGISIIFYSVGIMAQKYFEREEERLQKIWETAKGIRLPRQENGPNLTKQRMIDGGKRVTFVRRR
jgi:hypothetical protein